MIDTRSFRSLAGVSAYPVVLLVMLGPSAPRAACRIAPSSRFDSHGEVLQDRWKDKSPHTSHFVTLHGIKLHYLDWGGPSQKPAGGGKPETLLFLAGLSATAHIYDDLAPAFTDHFHVLALTRRGHGQSDRPETGYDIGTLVEDIHQFLDHLHIERVALVGHSLAGEEITRLAVLYPQRVTRLVYLDATCYHAELTGSRHPGSNLADPFPKFAPLSPPQDAQISSVALRTWYSRSNGPVWSAAVEANLRETLFARGSMASPVEGPPGLFRELFTSIAQTPLDYSRMKAPAIGFFATVQSYPNLPPSADYNTRLKAQRYVEQVMKPEKREQIDRFHDCLPRVGIVEIPDATHLLFVTSQEQVVHGMRVFLLPGR